MIASDQANTGPEILVDDHRFMLRGTDFAPDCVTLAYHFRGAARRPYVSTLVGPSGRNMLECAPADHAHHLGLWWGHGDVNGVDFYLELERDDMEHGRVEHVAFDEIVDDDPWFGFDESLEWRDPDGVALIAERRILLAHYADDRWYTVDLDNTYTACADLKFGDTKEAVMPGIRVAEALTTNGGGAMVSSGGGTGEPECFGKQAGWIDRCGNRRGVWHKEYAEGIAVFDHPSNQHPATWFARDYGPLSPFPGHHFLGGGSMATDESMRLRYRILVHEGDSVEADVAGHYERYVEESAVTEDVD